MTSYPVICGACKREHDRKAWQKLPLEAVHFECLDVRTCDCGAGVTAEVDGYGGASDHTGATRNMDALGA